MHNRKYVHFVGISTDGTTSLFGENEHEYWDKPCSYLFDNFFAKFSASLYQIFPASAPHV